MAIVYSTSSEGVDWAALKAELAADHFDNGRTPEQMERSFRASFRCVYTRDGERFIGTARALSDGVCNAYIVDMWTHSAYRRRGIGRALVRAAEDWAAQRGITVLQLNVYEFNDAAARLYEAEGFETVYRGMARGNAS